MMSGVSALVDAPLFCHFMSLKKFFAKRRIYVFTGLMGLLRLKCWLSVGFTEMSRVTQGYKQGYRFRGFKNRVTQG